MEKLKKAFIGLAFISIMFAAIKEIALFVGAGSIASVASVVCGATMLICMGMIVIGAALFLIGMMLFNVNIK